MMTKKKSVVQNFLEKATSPRKDLQVSVPINSFNSLFDVKKLTDSESNEIERILEDGYDASMGGDIKSDLVEVKRITEEIKAVKRQELVLVGERISNAREIFKKYKDRSFKQWIGLAFGSFKSGYNYLSLYDLYLQLPDNVRGQLKAMPAKAAYILASKDGSIEQKTEIVQNHGHEETEELILQIREAFGVDRQRKAGKRPLIDQILNCMSKETKKLITRKDLLSTDHKKQIQYLLDQLQKLVN